MRNRSRPATRRAPSRSRPPVGRLGAALICLAALLLGSVVPAAAADLTAQTPWTATLGGQNVESTSGGNPIVLDASGPVEVTLRVENRSGATVAVPFVRLQGTVLGLTFYAYTTRIDMEVPPRRAEERTFQLDLLDLGSQASGLIPSRISLLDQHGNVMSAKDMTVDVRGRLGSVYGLFGLAIAALTLLLLGVVLWRLATGRMSPNRWRRGLAVAAPGLGLGFVLTFSLSALRVTSPEPQLWSALLLGGMLIGFAAGYLSPTPSETRDEEETSDRAVEFDDNYSEDRAWEDETVEGAAVPAPRESPTGPVSLVPGFPPREPPSGDDSSSGRPSWPS